MANYEAYFWPSWRKVPVFKFQDLQFCKLHKVSFSSFLIKLISGDQSMISGGKMALTRKEVECASEMFSNTVRLQTPWWNLPERAPPKNFKKNYLSSVAKWTEVYKQFKSAIGKTKQKQPFKISTYRQILSNVTFLTFWYGESSVSLFEEWLTVRYLSLVSDDTVITMFAAVGFFLFSDNLTSRGAGWRRKSFSEVSTGLQNETQIKGNATIWSKLLNGIRKKLLLLF